MKFHYRNLGDEALFDLYCKGEVAAFDVYYERVSPKIWGYIKKRIQSDSLAEDIYQDTWSKIHRSREQYDQKFPINPWVFTIVRTVLYDGLRSIQRNKEVLPEEATMNQIIDQASIEKDSWQVSPDLDLKLAGLTPEQKNMIELRYLKDWSFDEIAISLDLNEDNVRQKISRIIKKIRRRFV